MMETKGYIKGQLSQQTTNGNLDETEVLRQQVLKMVSELEGLSADQDKLKEAISHIKTDTKPDELLSEVRLLLKKFPLANIKNFQYLHALQLTVANMEQQLQADRQKRIEQDEVIKELRLEVESLKKNRSANHEEQKPHMKTIMEEKMDYDYTDSIHKKSLESISTVDSVYNSRSDVSVYSFQDPSRDPNEKFHSLFDRMTAIEKKVEEVKKEQERAKQLERFVMHLHERIKSLDCGRSGRLLWKISGFNTIFDNAKIQETRKQKNRTVDSNSPCDFCSPLFYTAPQGYLMYMRLYPYGCDSAVGKYVSLFVALSPGEFDGVLPWPFTSTIEISILNQDDLSDKWTQTIVPGGNNLQCFQRPSSKSGNMSVGILHFILHNKLFGNSGGSSSYIKHDTMYVEVLIKEPESSHTGPSKAKSARSTPPINNTTLRGSPDYRPSSTNGGLTLM